MLEEDESSMNERRAKWARCALRTFAATLHTEGEPVAQNIGDLIADLLHLCDLELVDAEDVLDTALDHYRCEIEEDGRINAGEKRKSYIESSFGPDVSP